MPFDLFDGPATFQGMAKSLFKNLLSARVYFDDAVVGSQGIEEDENNSFLV